MNVTHKPSNRPVLIAASVLAAAVAVLLASFALAADRPAGGPAAAAESCKGADSPAADTRPRKLRKSIRCLINEARAVHGFGKLAKRRSVQKAAQRHTKTMVETDCLAHRCEGEVDLEGRLRQAGYFAGASSWTFAENTGCAISARAMIDGWLDVRFHRINILDKTFHDVGVGVVHRRVEDRCDKGFVTFAVVFGDRTP
jgi:uncharacterized protein YkwD